MPHPADKYIRTVSGPFAIVKMCTVPGCTFSHMRKKGGYGRGTGFREGNKSRGVLIQHFKECHPELMEKKA